MRWLIDGYNVIRRDADLRAAEEAGGLPAGRRALLRLVAGAARGSADRFTVVFDGARPHDRDPLAGQVEVLFSRPPRKADDVLVELGRRAGAGGAAVVSSDRAVQSAAQRARCAVVSAESFLARLQSAGPGDGAKDDDDGEERARPRGGNPRRASRKVRAARRALGRLGGPGAPRRSSE
jgi:predicted RNA-binding protein with PIN domain